jgi:hypothetical protein
MPTVKGSLFHDTQRPSRHAGLSRVGVGYEEICFCALDMSVIDFRRITHFIGPRNLTEIPPPPPPRDAKSKAEEARWMCVEVMLDMQAEAVRRLGRLQAENVRRARDSLDALPIEDLLVTIRGIAAELTRAPGNQRGGSTMSGAIPAALSLVSAIAVATIHMVSGMRSVSGA